MKEFLKGGGAVDMNEHGTTLLMEATNMKQLEIAKLLVAAHANVNAVSSSGTTPLNYALDNSEFGPPRSKDPAVVFGLVQLLVEAGAQVAPKDTGGDDKSPLAQAAKRGDLRIMKLLISKGADAKDPRALIETIDSGNKDATAMLLAAGAVVNPPAPAMGMSPIHQAISQGSIKIEMARYDKADAAKVAEIAGQWLAEIDVLLAAGANLSARDERGETALEAAINGGSIEILGHVLDAKPKLDELDGAGRTPLQFLAGLTRLEQKDLVPLAKLMLERKAPKQGAAAIAEKRKLAVLAKLLR